MHSHNKVIGISKLRFVLPDTWHVWVPMAFDFLFLANPQITLHDDPLC